MRVTVRIRIENFSSSFEPFRPEFRPSYKLSFFVPSELFRLPNGIRCKHPRYSYAFISNFFLFNFIKTKRIMNIGLATESFSSLRSSSRCLLFDRFDWLPWSSNSLEIHRDETRYVFMDQLVVCDTTERPSAIRREETALLHTDSSTIEVDETPDVAVASRVRRSVKYSGIRFRLSLPFL